MRFKLLLIGVGCVAVYFGVQEKKLAGVAKTVPQSLTLTELEANGPGDNAYVELADFVLIEWNYMYTTGKRDRWKEAWIPAVPIDGRFYQSILGGLDENGDWPEDVPLPTPDSVATIVKLPDARNEQDVYQVASQDVMEGMIINEIESLAKTDREFLEREYPGVDFGSCYIFEHGRKPKSGGVLLGYFAGGGLAALGGLAWLVLPFMRRRESAVVEREAEEEPAA